MIRKYEPKDKQELVEIFKLNVPIYFDAKEVSIFEEYLETHGDTYHTIEYENKIVGGNGYNFKDNNSIGEITWIFFHPNYSGFGLGRESVDYCLNLFRSTPNLNKVVVRTSQLANKFFSKLGFELIKTETDYWGLGLDLHLMELDFKKEKSLIPK